MSNFDNSSPAWPAASSQLARKNVPDPIDTDRVRHMLQAIERLNDVLSKVSLDHLLEDELPQSSAFRHFGILGTAAGATSPAFQLAHPTVAWKRWKRYGRLLIRQYDRVNYKLLHQKWQRELPSLREQLRAIQLLTEEAA